MTYRMLHWSSHWTNIWRQTYSGQLFNIFKQLIRLFIMSMSVVRVKRAGVSLFNLAFVLKEKRGDNSTTNSVLKIYWWCIEYTQSPRDHFKTMIFLDWLIGWCLMSSEQFSSYIQDENNLNATGIETKKCDHSSWA